MICDRYSWKSGKNFISIITHYKSDILPTKLLQLTNHPPDAPVKVLSADDFFARATQEEDWHDEEERETVKRFHNKVSVLKQNKKAVAGFQGGQHQHRCLHCRSDPQW